METNKSNRDIVYKCSRCGRVVGRDGLRTKRAVFRELGQHGRTLKSTTVAWLCVMPQPDGTPSCCDLDEDWNAPKWINTPGLADTRLAKENV